MRISTTDGKVTERPDRCGFCEITTGGLHQINCPAFPPEVKRYEQDGQKVKIKILKYDDDGKFVKEL